MIRILVIAGLVLAGAFPLDAADKPIPTLSVLKSMVGKPRNSAEVAAFLKKYDFGENPKRENSWGSSFGVFAEVDRDGKIYIGIRPPSEATNMPTYPLALPKGLKAGDSIEAIQEKLGQPLPVNHDPKVYYEMAYEGFVVASMRGRLFEIWFRDSVPPKSAKSAK